MIAELLASHSRLLAECAIAEPLSRLPDIDLHPELFNSPLIYGPDAARSKMEALYARYIAIAADASLPLLLTAPTWRLDAERLRRSDVPASINRDAVAYLLGVRERFATAASPVAVGALVGPKADCYRPDLAPGAEAAVDFHRAQVKELAATDADFLIAQTLPAVGEARGLARALAAAGKPYVISFCTGPDGCVLDGTPLPRAFDMIDDDAELRDRPVGYFVNCTHPSFHMARYKAEELERLIGIQANGSSKDVTSLDLAAETRMDPIDAWTDSMHRFQEQFGVSIQGGCCGTSERHMISLCRREGSGSLC